MKNTSIKNTAIPLLAALLLAGCEKEILINAEDQQALLVAHSFVEAGRTASVKLTLSKPVFGYHEEPWWETGFTPVTNATATLVVNGGITYSAQLDDNTYTFAYTAQVGDSLRLRLQAPGFDNLEATTTVPSLARVGQASFVTGSDDDDNVYSRVLRFSFQDPADEENYYSIRFLERDYYAPVYVGDSLVDWSDSSTHDMYFECDDPMFMDADISDFLNDLSSNSTFYGREMFFSDKNFNGSTHNVKITLYGGPFMSDSNMAVKLDMEVVSYSREEYNYRLCFQSGNDFDDILSFFSEPKQIYTNFEGGAGVLGAHTVRTVSLPVEIRQD